MSNYPVPPPSYQGNKSYSSTDETREPLLGGGGGGGAAAAAAGAQRAGPSAAGGNAIWDMPGDDVPDDFKYGVTVSESSLEIRNAFVRKVYSILFCQILATCIVGGVLSQSDSAILWVQTHTWALYVPLFATFVNLGLLFWKRHSVPTNYIFLGTFTLLEAFTLGVIMAFYDNRVILQALLITLGIFLGLTLFTFQSKYDFSGMGPWLFGALLALLVTGLVGMFVHFDKTMDLIFAIGGALIFSGYIVYDTYMISNRLSPDEYILGAISLYLDFINLFINILRLINNVEDR